MIISVMTTGLCAFYSGPDWKFLISIFLISLTVALASQFASGGRFAIHLEPPGATSFTDSVVICTECRALQQSVSACSECGGRMEEIRFWKWIP
jgi:hypothetical protein